ncbi:hypothetical protein EYS14_00300 [Alteromonadaceae bacterium M269]|nr:hypothetical protein EYS14_00300 [Alteromonadaceae bacterium M269]
MDWDGLDRRQTKATDDTLFRVMVGCNILGWIVFVAAMMVFHYARPEFISGVQQFWGIEGREHWESSLSAVLVLLLSICVFFSLATLVLKSRRARRKFDSIGVNLILLTIIASASLIGIYLTVY